MGAKHKVREAIDQARWTRFDQAVADLLNFLHGHEKRKAKEETSTHNLLLSPKWRIVHGIGLTAFAWTI